MITAIALVAALLLLTLAAALCRLTAEIDDAEGTR